MTPAGRSLRPLTRVVPASRALEGAGFAVHRPFPTAALDQLDPFLLLDEMGPADYGPGEATGAPDHPHRGFETVTYVLAGEVEHRDSLGNVGRIGAGDVQWMTAGAGVVHSEMPSERVRREGGRVHGFQLWVNLPASEKMIDPRYQSLTASDLGRTAGDGWTATVVAGSMLGVEGPAETRTPIDYAHIRLDAATELAVDLRAEHNVGVHVFSGRATVGADRAPVTARSLALFAPSEGSVLVGAPDDGAVELLVFAGLPLREPVARHGPFVMNTRAELIAAFEDHRAGRLGRIPRVPS